MRRAVIERPQYAFRPDPVLGWTLRPDVQVHVKFRPGVVETIDSHGRRTTPKPGSGAGLRVGVYGCSYIYGWGLADDETLVARLQKAYPEHAFTNNGVSGYGTVQSFLRFKKDVQAARIDRAIFGVISSHKIRNIPHPARLTKMQTGIWAELGVEHWPVYRRLVSGEGRIDYVPIEQKILAYGALDAFLPDAYSINATTVSLMRKVAAFAGEAGIPSGFAILDHRDRAFNASLLAHVPDSLDISTPVDEAHTHLPHDAHPNAAANQIFAERITPLVEKLLGRGEGAR